MQLVPGLLSPRVEQKKRKRQDGLNKASQIIKIKQITQVKRMKGPLKKTVEQPEPMPE